MASDAPKRRSPILRSFALGREVKRLLCEQRYELAVLISQTLLELRIEAELAHVAKTSQEPTIGEAALAVLGTYNLANPRAALCRGHLRRALRDRCPEEFTALKTACRTAQRHRAPQRAGERRGRARLAAPAKRGPRGRSRSPIRRRTVVMSGTS